MIRTVDLPRPRWPLDAAWWSPWTITRPWLPRLIRGCDEWHNPSLGVIVPPFGGLVVWRLRYRRDEESEHMNLWTRNEGWEGLIVADCPFCQELLAEMRLRG